MFDERNQRLFFGFYRYIGIYIYVRVYIYISINIMKFLYQMLLYVIVILKLNLRKVNQFELCLYLYSDEFSNQNNRKIIYVVCGNCG